MLDGMTTDGPTLTPLLCLDVPLVPLPSVPVDPADRSNTPPSAEEDIRLVCSRCKGGGLAFNLLIGPPCLDLSRLPASSSGDIGVVVLPAAAKGCGDTPSTGTPAEETVEVPFNLNSMPPADPDPNSESSEDAVTGEGLPSLDSDLAMG
jgi:hypothetical protein